MVEQAEADGHKAKRMFSWATEAEEVHAQLYARALEMASQGKDLDVTEFYLCPTCGYIEFGTPPEKCPICKLPGERFVQV